MEASNRAPVRAAVLTMSDLGARGEREDTSGDRIVEFLGRLEMPVVERAMIPDEAPQIQERLLHFPTS